VQASRRHVGRGTHHGAALFRRKDPRIRRTAVALSAEAQTPRGGKAASLTRWPVSIHHRGATCKGWVRQRSTSLPWSCRVWIKKVATALRLVEGGASITVPWHPIGVGLEIFDLPKTSGSISRNCRCSRGLIALTGTITVSRHQSSATKRCGEPC